MTGGLPIAAPYSAAVDWPAALAAWMDAVERRLANSEAGLVGPVQGFSWATDDKAQPAIIDAQGNLSSLSAFALKDLADRVATLEQQVLGPVDGWVWVMDGPTTFAVRSPGGRVFRVALLDSSLPAPVVALGDSNTTDTLPALTRIPWFDLIWPPPNAQNLAVGGHTWTVPGSKLIDDADGIVPSASTVILSAGINDLQAGVTEADIELAIADTVTTLNARGLDCVVATLFPIAVGSVFSSGLYATRNAQRNAINSFIKSNYVQKDGRSIDLAAAVEASPGGPLDPAYDLGDGLHLNQAGQAAVADAARAILRV